MSWTATHGRVESSQIMSHVASAGRTTTSAGKRHRERRRRARGGGVQTESRDLRTRRADVFYSNFRFHKLTKNLFLPVARVADPDPGPSRMGIGTRTRTSTCGPANPNGNAESYRVTAARA